MSNSGKAAQPVIRRIRTARRAFPRVFPIGRGLREPSAANRLCAMVVICLRCLLGVVLGFTGCDEQPPAAALQPRREAVSVAAVRAQGRVLYDLQG